MKRDKSEEVEDKEEAMEKHKEHEPEMKRGGRMKKRARGGIVGGKALKPAVAKRARGGRMTPSSPLSGADGPNLSYASDTQPKGSHGMGKDTD